MVQRSSCYWRRTGVWLLHFCVLGFWCFLGPFGPYTSETAFAVEMPQHVRIVVAGLLLCAGTMIFGSLAVCAFHAAASPRAWLARRQTLVSLDNADILGLVLLGVIFYISILLLSGTVQISKFSLWSLLENFYELGTHIRQLAFVSVCFGSWLFYTVMSLRPEPLMRTATPTSKWSTTITWNIIFFLVAWVTCILSLAAAVVAVHWAFWLFGLTVEEMGKGVKRENPFSPGLSRSIPFAFAFAILALALVVGCVYAVLVLPAQLGIAVLERLRGWRAARII